MAARVAVRHRRGSVEGRAVVKGRAAVARVEGMEAVVVVARVAEEGVMAAAAKARVAPGREAAA